ncbi:MAG: FtsK/SpoIIIE domain-containing protein [Planctomycetota bacterium]
MSSEPASHPPENDAETSAGPAAESPHEAAAVEPPLSSVGRRQVAALSDLIDLSNTCELTERQILAERDDRTAFVKKRYERSIDRAETRAAAKLRRFRKTRQERHEAIEAEAAQRKQKLDTDAQKVRAQIDGKAKDREAKSRGEYTHERWVADSVLEGRTNELKAEHEEDLLQLETMRKEADATDERVAETLKQYRQPAPPAREENAPQTPDESPAEAVPHSEAQSAFNGLTEQYAQQHDTLLAALRGLKRLLLPVLFLSFLPYLIWFVLTAGATVGLVVLGNTLGWAWSPVITGAGGFLVCGSLCWLLGRVLFGVATKQIARAHAQYQNVRTAQAKYFDQVRRAARAKLDAGVAEARAERDKSHAATELKFAPLFEKISARQKEASAELETKAAAQSEKLALQHDRERAAFEAESEATKEAVAERRARRIDIAERRQRRDLDRLTQRYEARYAALQNKWDAGRDRVLHSLDEMQQLEQTSNRPWDAPAWSSWSPPEASAPAVRFGSLHIEPARLLDDEATGGRFDLNLPPSLRVPALLSGPDQRSLYLAAPPEKRDEGLGVMSAVILRLLTTLPPARVKFTLIDPVGLGESFGGLMHLADHEDSLVNSRVWSEPSHIDRRLTDLTDHMGQMIQKYLRNDFASIDEYNAQAGELAEPYRFLVAADYPHGFSSEAAARLNSIAASGARSGVFVLVLHDLRQAPPAGEIDDLRRHCTVVTHGDDGWRWRHPVCERFDFTPDEPPPEELTTDLVGKIGRAAIDAGRVQVPFHTITPADDGACWSRRAPDDIAVPVGRSGATRLQDFRLGVGVAQHALVAGKTGSGKSSLLHTLITNLCLWYPPDQLELYLIDFKKGVEFKPYVNNRPPHLRAVAIESDREFGLSIFKRLDAMLDERGETFRAAGVANLSGYHKAVPGDPMPRVMLIVDEFQEMFSQDDAIAQNATLLLDRLVRQGRAFGMHVFLGSQSLSGAAGLPRGTMGQMAVRIALQCSENDSQLILGDENSAARLLSRPGEAIYNDQGGSLEANNLFQVAWLPDHELRQNLDRIRALAERHDVRAKECFVFEGNAAASLADNAPLNRLLDAPDWAAADTRAAAHLGEPIAIDDPISVAFPRLNGSNAVILGQNADATLGLLTTSILSLAAGHHPDRARFVVMSGSTEPEHDTLVRDTLGALPHGVAQVPFRDVDTTLAELHAELKRRIEDGGPDDPAIFIAVFGLQRFRQFRKSDEGFSFSLDDDAGGSSKPDEQIMEILRDGPVVGMHLLIACDRAASLEQVFDRRALREFDNRVMFQMSATDSAQLIDSSAANDLGPYRALLYREDRGTIARFRPYGVPSDDDLTRFKTALNRPFRRSSLTE